MNCGILDMLFMSSIRLLLGSGGHVPPDRRHALVHEIQDFLGKSVQTCLFVPYAHDKKTWAIAREEYYELGFNAGYDLDPISEHENQIEAVRSATAFYFDGGNTFRLLKTLYDLNIFEEIKKKIISGTPFIGLSAGANIVCPSIRTTNDMPIVIPPTLDAMNLLPFQINTHYVDMMADPSYRAETRSIRIHEFQEENDFVVVGLREGAILRREGDNLFLRGTNGARIFEKGKMPKDVLPEDPVDFLLRK